MRPRLIALLACACAALGSTSAAASALRVSPVLLEMSPTRPSAVVVLHNEGDQPLTVQLRVFHWRNGADGDVLTPATEVAASPPFARVAPGSEQTVRLVRTDGAPLAGEQAYRLLVDELPPAELSQGQTVTLLMRQSIPVFVAGAGPHRADVEWAAAQAADGGFQITAANHGQRRQRVADVKLYDAGGRLLAERSGLLGYVLSASTAAWRLPAVTNAGPGAGGGAPAKLSLETDQGHQDVSVSAAKR